MTADESVRRSDGQARDAGGQLTIGQRVRQPQTLLSFLFAILLILFLVSRVEIDPADVLRQLGSANPFLFGLGLLTFYAGFMLRVVRWRLMLTRAGVGELPDVHLPSRGGLLEIMLLAWFTNCILPAKLGDVYRGFLLKRRSNAPFTTAMGTVAAERLIDLAVLVVLFVLSSLIVFEGHVPSDTRTVVIYGGSTTMAAVVVVGVVWMFRNRLMGYLPERLTAPADRVQTGLFENLKRPWRSVGYSLVIWSAEGARFFFVAWSLDTMLRPSTALFIALVGSLAAASPITPAGLGVVEAILMSVLALVGVGEDIAAAIVILDRIISYWSLIVVGLPLYTLHVRRDVRTAVRHERSTA